MGDLSYTLGALRKSSMGFEEVMEVSGEGAGGGGGEWKGKEGKRLPVWAIGVGKGEVGKWGSTAAAEN